MEGYAIPEVSTRECESVTLTGRARAMLRRHPSTKASFSMVTVKEHNGNDTVRGRVIPVNHPVEPADRRDQDAPYLDSVSDLGGSD